MLKQSKVRTASQVKCPACAKKPQLIKYLAHVVAPRQGIDPVTLGTFEESTRQSAFTFHVPNDRLD